MVTLSKTLVVQWCKSAMSAMSVTFQKLDETIHTLHRFGWPYGRVVIRSFQCVFIW